MPVSPPNPDRTKGPGPTPGEHQPASALLTIRDDRGRTHPLRIGMVPWDEVHDASHLSEHPTRRPGLLYEAFTGAITFILLLGWGFAPEIARALGIPRWLGLIIAIAMFTAITAVLILVWRFCGARWVSLRGRGDARRSQAIAHHVRIRIARDRECPVCAYPLDGLEPEEDHCTVCAECGAAWRADRWTADAGIYRSPAVNGQGRGVGKGLLTTRDARGIWVPLLASKPKRVRQDTITKWRDRAAGPIRRRHMAGTSIWLGVTGVVAGVSIFAIGPASLADFIYIAVVTGVVSAILFTAVLFAIRASDFQVLKPIFVQDQVAKNRCPCCESPLRPTLSPIDACLLCDTCGSAWNPPDPPPPA